MKPTPRHRFAAVALISLALSACDRDGDGSRRRHDCDDFDPDRFPGNREVCDGIDNDCDYAVDENLTRTFYRDADGDGRGTRLGEIRDCARPVGYSDLAGDCDDGDRTVYAGAPERCDGKDNDCDGFVDVDGSYAQLYSPDLDGDGHGDRYAREVSCLAAVGWAPNADDCDDGDAGVNPRAAEVCDGKDNDCDGSIDDVPGGCP